MIDVDVLVDLSRLQRFKDSVANSEDGPIRAAIRTWARRYRSFVQLRFDSYSKGGGNWAPLSPITLAGRRQGKTKGGSQAAILRNTGMLFMALTPVFTGAPGAVEEHVPYGVIVGFGGPGRYNDGGRATIADIAAFHQAGNARLPKREIIVAPPANVVLQMAEDMRSAIRKLSDV